MYVFFEKGKWKKPKESLEEDTSLDSKSYDAIKKTELHKIVTKPTMFPYYDMVSWIISHAHVQTCSIVNHSNNVIYS